MKTHMPRRWRVPLGVCLLLGVVYFVSMATFKVTNDVQTTSLMSWRIAQTGTPWFDGFDYRPWEGPEGLWMGEAANGHIAGFRSPGPVAAGVPAYLIMRLLEVDGYSLVPGSVTATLVTTLALGLLFLAIRARVGDAVAAGAVVVLGLTTPVWSVSADSLWTHPVTLLGIAGMAWAADRDRWWLVGLFGAVSLWGRLHTVVIVAILGLAVAVARRRPRVALQAGVVSAAGLALATVWGKWMYGTWSPAGGYSIAGYTDRAAAVGGSGGEVMDRVVNHLGLWVAPDRGILVWTPVLLLLLPAVVRGWRELPDWSRWLAAGGVAYTLVQGQLNGFSGGSGFYGYRLTLELLACVFPAYAMSLTSTGRWTRRLLGPLLGLQLAVISVGASGDGGMLKEDYLWTDNSFLFALREVPVLAVWPLLMILIGWFVGRVVLRHAALQTSLESPTRGDQSDVGSEDELDRVRAAAPPAGHRLD